MFGASKSDGSETSQMISSGIALRCPLCPAIGAQTISEGLTIMDVAVFAKLAELRETPSDDQTNARFEVIEILYGESILVDRALTDHAHAGHQKHRFGGFGWRNGIDLEIDSKMKHFPLPSSFSLLLLPPISSFPLQPFAFLVPLLQSSQPAW